MLRASDFGTGKADGNQGGGAGGPREGGEVGLGEEVMGGKRGRVGGGEISPPKSSALSHPGVVIGLSYMKEELVSQLEEIAKRVEEPLKMAYNMASRRRFFNDLLPDD